MNKIYRIGEKNVPHISAKPKCIPINDWQQFE